MAEPQVAGLTPDSESTMPSCPLLARVSRDIRLLIWEHLLLARKVDSRLEAEDKERRDFQPAVLRTCKAIHEEARPVLYENNNFIHVRCNWSFMERFLLKYGFCNVYRSRGGDFKPKAKVLIAFPWPDYPREKMKSMKVPHLRVRHSFAEDTYPFNRYVLLADLPIFLSLVGSLDLQYTFRDEGNLRGTRYHIEIQQTSIRTQKDLLEPFKPLHGAGQTARIVGAIEPEYAREIETAMVHLNTPQEAATRVHNLGLFWEKLGDLCLTKGRTMMAAQVYGQAPLAVWRATNRDRRLLRFGGIRGWDERNWHLLLANHYNLAIVSLKNGDFDAARQFVNRFTIISKKPKAPPLIYVNSYRAKLIYISGITWFVRAADCKSVEDLRTTVRCFSVAHQTGPNIPEYTLALRVAKECLELYGTWELPGDSRRSKEELAALIKTHVRGLVEAVPLTPMEMT